ncbi:MAG: hypothetical protein ACYCW6_16725, partial [Candidatus Xenobia bacterium]
YLVYPDPKPPDLPRYELGSQFHLLWEASCACARGLASRQSLTGPLVGVKTKLDDILGGSMLPAAVLEHAASCIRALERIRRFTTSREVADLNGGWGELLPAARALREEAVRVGAVKAGEQPVEGEPDACWMNQLHDSVAVFDNPDD